MGYIRTSLPKLTTNMLSGTIRTLNADKGFGFIKPSAGGADVFFHCSAADTEFSQIKIEQSVQYELDTSAEKPRARQVVAGGPPRQGNAASQSRSSSPRSTTRSPARPTGKKRTSDDRREIEYLFGYITKLPRKNPIGFISATTGGAEFYFEPDFVKGKKFDKLKVGDYVRFIPKPNPENPKEPLAKAVEVVPRPINKQENNLKRHPKARRKKPTWRS